MCSVFSHLGSQGQASAIGPASIQGCPRNALPFCFLVQLEFQHAIVPPGPAWALMRTWRALVWAS